MTHVTCRLTAKNRDQLQPKTVTDKLQRVLNAAARVVSDTRKFDRGLTTLLHDELHWLDVPEGSARQNESLFRSNGTHVFVLLGFRSDGISFQLDGALQRIAY